MTEPNFEQMDKSDLKAYLRKHPDNQKAFYALKDKINSEPSRTRYKFDDPAGDEELRKAVERKKQIRDDVA